MYIPKIPSGLIRTISDVNDHDPKPLYYQFQAEHAGAFQWDYLEKGSDVWRVRIGRKV